MRNGAVRPVAAMALILLVSAGVLGASTPTELVRLGIVADTHVHDTNSPGEEKVMVNYAERLTAFVEAMNAAGADAVIQLGDLVNGNFVFGGTIGDPARIGGLLAEAVTLLAAFDGPVYHVAGNHDFYDLSLPEYIEIVGIEKTVYSFDIGGFHIVILDAEYNPDGSHYDHVSLRVKGQIPSEQLDWLRHDLAATALPTIVCVHQPLDSDFEVLAGGPPIANHLEVRRILADSGVVVAVFQGHDHENRYARIDGIHYVTFAEMVDHPEPTPPTWALVTLDASEGSVRIEGAGLQADYDLRFEPAS